MNIEFHQARSMIDGVFGGAGDFHEKFLEDIASCFPNEMGEQLIKSGLLSIKYLNHIPENLMQALQMGKQTRAESDTTSIEVTIQNQLVALLYERRTSFNHAETISFINKELIKSKQIDILSTLHGYYKLPYSISLVHTIDDEDFEIIKHIIDQTDTSDYMLDRQDFIAIKNDQEDIVGFARLYQIGEGQKEISSVWIDPAERGFNMGLYLCKQLLYEKKGNDEVYLACKAELKGYYKKLGFYQIENNIPEKLVHTLAWARDHGKEFIVMKF